MRLLSERGAVNPEGLWCFSGQCRTEHPNDEWRIWLEDIQETPKTWTVERHGIAARHLGQFNGAYLTGRPLPAEQPWLYRGRAREWIEFAAPMFEGFQHDDVRAEYSPQP